jgi:ABC-2 type transport system ATP-binding protein
MVASVRRSLFGGRASSTAPSLPSTGSISTSRRLAVRETLTHLASLYDRPRDVDGLLDAVGLTEQALPAPGSCRVVSNAGSTSPSGGGPAGTAVPDEPTIGFDPRPNTAFWDLIRRLRDDGTTILLTTHYLEEAEALADGVAGSCKLALSPTLDTESPWLR